MKEAFPLSWKANKTSTKGISSSKCDVWNWIFSKFLRNCWEIFWIFLESFGSFSEAFFRRNFLGEMFLRIFLGGYFGRNFLGKIFGGDFLEDFFGRIFLGGFFWEDFFGRNSLGGINKELMYFSRF